ncbi:ATP-binding protein [bacterium]|nr:ATP-binding protein [bacterium]
MKNPFVYGKEVSGDNFCNRKREKNELYRDIINGQNVIIFSQRRLGKTSLINEVFNKCRKKGIIPIYVDLYPMLSEEDFIRIYAKSIAEVVWGKIRKKLKEITQFFHKVRPTFTVNQTGEISYSFDVDRKAIIPSIEDVLDGVKRYADRKKKKVTVCFDEFQQIGQLKTDKLEKIMRSSFQKHNNIAYVFMGSKKHLITDMFNNPNRPFYRSTKSFPLEKINKCELSLFIQDRFQTTGKSISKDLIGEILDICELHPYYVQYFCHIIWERAIDRKIVKQEDLREGLKLLLKRESSTYEATWDLLTVKQKQVLVAISKVSPNDKLFSSEFLEKHNLGSASSVQRTVRSLINKDLIDKAGEMYMIIDIFFKKWILQL